MISNVYVSQSLINAADRNRMMDDIMTVSIARNTMLGITGLLIASPDHFVQLLEGSVLGVEEVMHRIGADPRHTACRIIRQSSINAASCRHFRMARFDYDNFGTAVIDPLLMAVHTGMDANAIRRLECLIEAVAKDHVPSK